MPLTVDRRGFLRTTSAGATGALLTGGAGAASAAPGAWTNGKVINPAVPNTRVVCCSDTKMLTNINASGSFTNINNAVDTARVEANMDGMARLLTGLGDSAAAWDAIFQKPPAKAWESVTVAIKVNSIDIASSARVAVVGKICKELVRKRVKPSAITVYDLNYGTGVDVVALYSPFIGKGIPAGVMVRGKSTPCSNAAVPGSGGNALCATFIYDGSTDILVNIASNKGHYLAYCGAFTLTMKNHMGTFAPSHDTGYLMNINKSDAIVGGNPPRQQLCIVDSLWAVKGGPFGASDAAPCRLVMGTLSPAVDYFTIKKIREPVMKTSHDGGIVDSLLSNFGLSPGGLEWIETGPVDAAGAGEGGVVGMRTLRVVYPDRASGSSICALRLPHDAAWWEVAVVDMKGNVVRRLGPLEPGLREPTIAWNGRSDRGASVASGVYLVRASAGGRTAGAQLTMAD